MNLKKSVISIILVFIVAMVWNGLYHMIFIAEQNALISGLRRPDISEKMFLSLFITITMTILFVVSYSKWLRKGTLYESIIHGLFFSILAGVLVMPINILCTRFLDFSLFYGFWVDWSSLSCVR